MASSTGGGSVTNDSTLTSQSGTASVTWALGATPGENVAEARVASLAPVSFSATALVGNAAALRIRQGNDQESIAGLRLPDQLRISVEDEFGNPVPNVEVDWVVTSGNGAIEPDSDQSDSEGLATATWILGEAAGVQTARAEINGTTASAEFSATALAPPLLTAGGGQTCATMPRGEAYCWGENGRGQVGSSPTSTCSDEDDEIGCTLSPTLVESDPWSALTAGGWHTCGLDDAGAAHCWGYNLWGTLGNRSRQDSQIPQAVAGGFTYPSIDAGRLSTCAISATNKAAYCWGNNWGGQLGNRFVATGGVDDATVEYPVPVSGGIAFEQVTVGGWHACGVEAGGKAYCWGYQADGRLGNGVADTLPQPEPMAVRGGLTFQHISAGLYHTCGVTGHGAAYCWGWNGWGQLGDNSYNDSATPVPVAGGHEFLRVEAGGWHTCGVTADSEMFCWGANDSGRLGTTSAPVCGTSTCSATPLRVERGHSFKKLAVGAHHSCAFTDDFDLYCWGRGNMGQLGTGGTSDSAAPRLVDLSFTGSLGNGVNNSVAPGGLVWTIPNGGHLEPAHDRSGRRSP